MEFNIGHGRGGRRRVGERFARAGIRAWRASEMGVVGCAAVAKGGVRRKWKKLMGGGGVEWDTGFQVSGAGDIC